MRGHVFIEDDLKIPIAKNAESINLKENQKRKRLQLITKAYRIYLSFVNKNSSFVVVVDLFPKALLTR